MGNKGASFSLLSPLTQFAKFAFLWLLFQERDNKIGSLLASLTLSTCSAVRTANSFFLLISRILEFPYKDKWKLEIYFCQLLRKLFLGFLSNLGFSRTDQKRSRNQTDTSLWKNNPTTTTLPHPIPLCYPAAYIEFQKKNRNILCPPAHT